VDGGSAGGSERVTIATCLHLLVASIPRQSLALLSPRVLGDENRLASEAPQDANVANVFAKDSSGTKSLAGNSMSFERRSDRRSLAIPFQSYRS
jgi:hypothetical protein